MWLSVTRNAITNKNPPDNEIISIFKRYLGSGDPSEIDKLDLEELIAAEARLRIRGINPNFSEVIKTKIKYL